MNRLDDLLHNLWQHYARVNVQAHDIHAALQAMGEQVVNDHIAFRTFNHPKLNVDALAKTFLQFGYVEKGHYTFAEKQLNAKHYEHPEERYPRIFISELLVERFSKDMQAVVQELVDAVPDNVVHAWDFCASNVVWPMIPYATYEALRRESEYAAWLAAFGFCANHFTISINALQGFADLAAFNEFIRQSGYALNTAAGEIKGGADVYLEQSSTLASPVKVAFADGEKEIPCCYYEFAKRYPLPDGTLFNGFVAKSADKIFESTDKR